MVVVLDRFTKDLAVATLTDGPRPFIPGILGFHLTYNRGAAWGLFAGGRVVFILIALAAVIGVFVYLFSQRRHAALTVLGFGLFLGGTIGNAIDRALAGQVVDFLQLQFMDVPLFNLADPSITISVALLLLVIFVTSRATAGKTAEVASSEGEADPDAAAIADTDEPQGTSPDGQTVGDPGDTCD
jgi:signal peptidase II